MKCAYLGELGCRDGEVIGFDATEGEGREEGGRKECGEHFGGSVQRAYEERESSGFIRPGGEAQEGGGGRQVVAMKEKACGVCCPPKCPPSRRLIRA